MRPYGKEEIKDKAKACFGRQVCGNGLANAKKIIAEVRRLLATEIKRRKTLSDTERSK